VNTPFPTVEFTLAIPRGGCPVACAMCPQDVLAAAYKGKPLMDWDDFRSMLAELPPEVRVTFSGFCEPSIHPKFVDMVLFAAKTHPVSVFTTAVGLAEADVDKLATVKYSTWPNGGFCLHLPDTAGYTSIPLSAGYLAKLQRFRAVKIEGFWTIVVGELAKELSDLFPDTRRLTIQWRSGNLPADRVPGVEAAGNRGESRTCGCQEKLYHNVVTPDGEVYLCCMDFGLKHRLGSLRGRRYGDIIPAPDKPFGLCSLCENGIEVKS